MSYCHACARAVMHCGRVRSRCVLRGRLRSEDHGQYYYHNWQDGSVQWEKPSTLGVAEADPYDAAAAEVERAQHAAALRIQGLFTNARVRRWQGAVAKLVARQRAARTRLRPPVAPLKQLTPPPQRPNTGKAGAGATAAPGGAQRAATGTEAPSPARVPAGSGKRLRAAPATEPATAAWRLSAPRTRAGEASLWALCLGVAHDRVGTTMPDRRRRARAGPGENSNTARQVRALRPDAKPLRSVDVDTHTRSDHRPSGDARPIRREEVRVKPGRKVQPPLSPGQPLLPRLSSSSSAPQRASRSSLSSLRGSSNSTTLALPEPQTLGPATAAALVAQHSNAGSGASVQPGSEEPPGSPRPSGELPPPRADALQGGAAQAAHHRATQQKDLAATEVHVTARPRLAPLPSAHSITSPSEASSSASGRGKAAAEVGDGSFEQRSAGRIDEAERDDGVDELRGMMAALVGVTTAGADRVYADVADVMETVLSDVADGVYAALQHLSVADDKVSPQGPRAPRVAVAQPQVPAPVLPAAAASPSESFAPSPSPRSSAAHPARRVAGASPVGSLATLQTNRSGASLGPQPWERSPSSLPGSEDDGALRGPATSVGHSAAHEVEHDMARLHEDGERATLRIRWQRRSRRRSPAAPRRGPPAVAHLRAQLAAERARYSKQLAARDAARSRVEVDDRALASMARKVASLRGEVARLRKVAAEPGPAGARASSGSLQERPVGVRAAGKASASNTALKGSASDDLVGRRARRAAPLAAWETDGETTPPVTVTTSASRAGAVLSRLRRSDDGGADATPLDDVERQALLRRYRELAAADGTAAASEAAGHPHPGPTHEGADAPPRGEQALDAPPGARRAQRQPKRRSRSKRTRRKSAGAAGKRAKGHVVPTGAPGLMVFR